MEAVVVEVQHRNINVQFTCLLYCHGKTNIVAEFEHNYFYCHVCECFVGMYVCVQVCAQCLRRPEDKVGSPAGIADSCEQPYGC